jgi:leucyl-tRNA synthetase
MPADPTNPAHPPRADQAQTSASADADQPAQRYTAALASRIESKWQDYWDQHRTFTAPNPGEPGFDPTRPKQYILDMFPYPSGVGLHVGHPLGYIATDIYARFLRMTGHNVLHAMGYDAFGLPAEQYAVQTNTHPRVTTERNIATMRAQLRRLGLAHEARRSVATTDPEFYRWTQWIFLQIYNSWYDPSAPQSAPGHAGNTPGRARPISELIAQFERGERKVPGHDKPWSQLPEAIKRQAIDAHRLAYLAEVPVNWCPKLGTVLANEEVIDGKSERGGFPVYRRPLKQWMMRITAYADRLLTDLDGLDWPEPIKLMQRNWIGRSEGALVDFDCSTRRIRVFTTRPDTLFGATYMVLAPEHELVDQIAAEKYGSIAFKPACFPGADALLNREAGGVGGASPRELIAAYRAYAAGKSDKDRQEGREKTGVFTGAYAVNPINGARVPVFIADYVLSGYGTGAIMAVPAHDERDFEFAEEFGLPIVDVVYPRATLAMRYFCEHATPEEEAGPLWRARLADFLGLVTSRSADEAGFAECLSTVRTRRSSDTVPASAPPPARAGQPARGVVQMQYLETIENLSVESVAQLREIFRARAFQKHTGNPMSGPGFAVNSPPPPPAGAADAGAAPASAPALFSINGRTSDHARQAVTRRLEEIGRGRLHVQYKLRDWLFSRQRYWGEPFPIVYDEQGVTHAIPESMLPVLLPHVENFQPESSDDPNAPVRTPLDRAGDWRTVELDLGDGRGTRRFTRETNTMPNWAGSCWYYLRYLDPASSGHLARPETERYWMAGALAGSGASGPRLGGVDLYVGGVEHAVLHLLYARFWHKVLFDLGHVSTTEPFQRLFNQGYIQAYAFKDARGFYVPAEEVEERQHEVSVDVDQLELSSGEKEPLRKATRFFHAGQPVFREYGKMGKSLKNAVSPDAVCAEYGCDTLRVYEMSMGPLEASKPWNTRDIAGAYRFLQRVWRNLIDEHTGLARVADGNEAPNPGLLRALHKTIAGVRKDMQGLSFNTAVAKLIEFNNELTKQCGPDSKGAGGISGGVPRAVAEPLTLLLAPLAPHMAEELWHRLGHARSLAFEPFPLPDAALAADDQIEVPVQVLGKLRGKIVVPAGSDAKALEAAALADEKIQQHLAGKPVKKVIVVPGKLVNLVV